MPLEIAFAVGIALGVLASAAAAWVNRGTTVSAADVTRLMAQAHEEARSARAAHDKLVQQFISVMRPAEYLNFRKGNALGVPAGATQAVHDHAQPVQSTNGEGRTLTREEVAIAAQQAIRDTMDFEQYSSRPITNPADVDRGSGLP